MTTTLSISVVCLMAIGSGYSVEKSKVKIIDSATYE
jgi:hypothetical protein